MSGPHDVDRLGVDSSAQIRVDIGDLREFAVAVRAHVDGSLRGQVRRAYQVYEQGVGFGPALTHSGDVRAARERYYECLTSMSAVLDEHLRKAEAMVLAAEEVAGRYRGVDAMAAASAVGVEAAWTSAYAAAQLRVAGEEAAFGRLERGVR
jgi:hypothetical protein